MNKNSHRDPEYHECQMMSKRLHIYFTKSFYRMLLKVCLVILMIWSFTLGIKFFIRQEIFDSNLFLSIALMTLPGAIPYLCCITAMLFIIQLGNKKELHLCILMGINRIKISTMLLYPILTLMILTIIYEGSLKPNIKYSLNYSAQELINKKSFNTLDSNQFYKIDSWFYKKSKSKNVLINTSSGNMCIIADQIESKSIPQFYLILKKGMVWPNTHEVNQIINFNRLSIPLQNMHQSKKSNEKNLIELTKHFTQNDQKVFFIMMRNVFSIPILILLGICLGAFTISTNKIKGYTLTLTYVLCIYFPLTIIGKKVVFYFGFVPLSTIFLPLFTTLALIFILNKYCDRKGFNQ